MDASSAPEILKTSSETNKDAEMDSKNENKSRVIKIMIKDENDNKIYEKNMVRKFLKLF